MKIAGLITMLVSLMISIVSGYCTVVGMGKVFVSAAYVTMFIATVIEIGRVVLIYDLHHYWHTMKFMQKLPGILMLLISITLSAMGIFGFMSNAHSQRTQEIVPIEMEIHEKEQQIEILKNEIEINNQQLQQFDDKAISKYTEMGYVTKAVNLQKEQQKVTNEIYNDNRSKQSEINKINQEILKLKLDAEQKAPTLAHIKYYAKLFNVDNDTAIIIFIVMIMLVFDTLAMYLMITADWINTSPQNYINNVKPMIVNNSTIDSNIQELKSMIEKYNKPVDNSSKESEEKIMSAIQIMKENIDDKLSKIQDKSIDFSPLTDMVKTGFDKISSQSVNEELINKLNKISDKLNKNNIDNYENDDILLDKITNSIDNNENVILSERFISMIEDNPKILEKLKKIYKNIPEVLEKLNKL